MHVSEPTEGQEQLLDTAQVADILGVSASAVRKLVTRGRFPLPDMVIASHRAWYRTTIERYQTSQRRGRGRPRGQSQAIEQDTAASDTTHEQQFTP